MKRNMQHCVWTVSLCATLLLNVGCSAGSPDENQSNTAATVELSDAQFSLQETPYEASKEFTRSFTDTSTPQSTSSFNGLDTEVTVEPDNEPAAPQTRAPMVNQRYTIYATDLNGNYIEGTKISGIASKSGNGVVFKPYATSLKKMSLEAGKKYIFVCFNEHIKFDNKNLTIENGADALLGVTEPIYVTNSKFRVAFNMKHQTARVRIKICGYTKQGGRMQGDFSSTSYLPATTVLKANGEHEQIIDGLVKMSGKGFLANFEGNYSGQANLSYTDDQFYYFIDHTLASHIKFTFNWGSLYGKDLKGASFTLPEMSLQKNHSYVVKVKIKALPLYLFGDGVVGTLVEHPNRVPIGIVAQEKTDADTQNGLAIALSDAQLPIDAIDDPRTEWAISPWNKRQVNSVMTSDFYKNLSDMSGYEWTWSPNHSRTTKANAEDPAHFPAFFAASTYYPRIGDNFIDNSKVSKWFLPSLGQWRVFITNVLKVNVEGNQMNDMRHITFSAKCPPEIIDKWFTDAKGGFGQPLIGGRMVKDYWSSTQCNCIDNALAEQVYFSADKNRNRSEFPYGIRFMSSSSLGFVRPFVKF